MTMAVQALKAHLALNVHNVERSIAFYQKLLGIEPSEELLESDAGALT